MGRKPRPSTIESLENEICDASEDELLDDLLTPIAKFGRKNGRNSWATLKDQYQEEARLETQRSRKDNS